MKPVNIIAISLILVVIVYEAWLIWRRNRTIVVKGKDDFLLLMLALVAALFIFPFQDNDLVEEAARNLLALMALLTTVSIKRGFSPAGLEKVLFTVPWQNISMIEAAGRGDTEAVFYFHRKKGGKWKLLFKMTEAKAALDYCAARVPDVKVDPRLFQNLQKYDTYRTRYQKQKSEK